MFNKESDYRRGFIEHCVETPGGIGLETGEPKGIFISRMLDSRDFSTVWHRVTMDITSQGDASVQIAYYTSDSDTIPMGGEPKKIQDIIKDPALSGEEKQELFWPYLRKRGLHPSDDILFDLRGRYLWFAIVLYGGVQEQTAIRNIQIFFPKESWIRYLPEIYQKDSGQGDFLERFLAVFQTMDEDLTRVIRNNAAYLDADITVRTFLEWLSSWIHIEDVYIWKDEQLRTLLRDAKDWFPRRGTAGCLVYLVQLYTGDDVFYLEPGQNGNGNQCSIVINPKDDLTQQEFYTVKKLIDENRPAHVDVQLIVLDHHMRLGDYNYLGLNSQLGHYAPTVLDGGFRLSMTELTGDT